MKQGFAALTLLLVSVFPGAFFPSAGIGYGAELGQAGELGQKSEWFEEEPDFLSVDEAFVLSTERAADGAVLVRWEMVDGYYLYRHRFEFETRDGATFSLGPPEIPPGKRKVDEYFGEVEVYYHQAQARIPVDGVDANEPIEIGIGYQGCADLGLCYPPETKWVTVGMDGSATGLSAAVSIAGEENATPDQATESFATEEQSLANVLSDSNLLVALALFFVLGIGLAFTPCVLPMVPILSSIIVGESKDITRRRAFILSLAYVLGMAFTYAAIGTLVGLFGASLNLQAALQSPLVLISFAIIFVVLSFSMFGFYELQLPQGVQNRLNAMGQNLGGGKIFSVVVMGSLSSLVVSPCVSAPLAGALIYISTNNDALLGGTALLALGLGMGVPLLVIGSSGGHLLPRAGAWMDNVKAVFGVMLIAVAVWLLERVVAPSVTLALWAILAIGSGVYLGALDFTARSGWGQLWKALGIISLLYGVLLMIGAASGAQDPLRPLQAVTESKANTFSQGAGGVDAVEGEWQAINNIAGLDAQLAALEGPAMLDFYADWCISCKVMERSVFPAPEVSRQLAQFHLLRADITENNAEHKALLNRFRLFGPPSLLFFDEDGRELTTFKIQGEMDEGQFSYHLSQVLASL